MNPFNPNTTQTPLIQLEAIQIASPCRADWNRMRGDDQIRHCTSCAKNVYNLSAMTRDEATRLIREKEGNLCIQLHRRQDGTVITSDCAVGIQSQNRSIRRVPRFFALVAAAIAGVFGMQTVHAAPMSKGRPSATVTGGKPMMREMGEAPDMGAMTRTMGAPAVPKSDHTGALMGRMIARPTLKKKDSKKSGKNHGKRNSGNAKRGAKAKSNR